MILWHFYQSEATSCVSSVNRQHCHVGPIFFSTSCPTCLTSSLSCTICSSERHIHSSENTSFIFTHSRNHGLQKMQCKNRPWDLFIHLHIVRQNIACFCKAVQVTRHNLFHQLNHNKVLNKKYNIFFKNQYNILLGNFLSVSACDFYKVAPQTICTKISWHKF